MNNRKICTLVGSDKGGVGKSMISLVMALVFDGARRPLRVVEIDNQKKLSSVLGSERVDLSISAAPDLGDISRNRHAAESFFNDVYMEWTKSDSVTDLGANVTTPIMSWFRHCDIGELAAEDSIDFRFVACASPDEQAIISAMSAIDLASETLSEAADYFVVLNDITGSLGFTPYQNEDAYKALEQMEREGKIKILRVSYCNSILMEQGRALHMDPIQVLKKSGEVARAAGLDLVSERVHKKKLENWLRESHRNLAPLMTVSQPARRNERDHSNAGISP